MDGDTSNKRSKIILIVQYFEVENADSMYKILRQKEIDQCLKRNLENPLIDEIHLLNEKFYPFDFIDNKYKDKIKQIIIKERLKYSFVIEYYNKYISNTICILSNADIFMDESLEILRHVNFDNTVLALNRYEYDSEDINKSNILSGLCDNSRDRHNCRYLEPFQASVWTQDVWIWKMKHLNIKGVNFNLGVPGCDNSFAFLLDKHGYNVYNPSRLLSVNHYDQLNIKVDNHGKYKGSFAQKREKRIGSHNTYKYLENIDDISDKYTLYSNKVNFKYSFIQGYNFRKNLIQFPNTSFIEWVSKSEIPFLEYIFTKPTVVCILDLMGKHVDKDNISSGFVTSFNISYLTIENTWIETDIFKGIHTKHGNFIKRIYLEDPIKCLKIRIHPLTFSGIPVLKLRMFGKFVEEKEKEKENKPQFVSKYINKYMLTYYDNDWQEPVITEKGIFQNLSQSSNLPFHYFAFPWATYIDSKWTGKTRVVKDLDNYIENKENQDIQYFTVIQHIHYLELLPIFQKLQIRYVFASHCSTNNKELEKRYNLISLPLPLFPLVNGIEYSYESICSRKYLINFVGYYSPIHYMSNIREKIFTIFKDKEGCFVKNRDLWHYQRDVYITKDKEKHVNKQEQERIEYKELMANSKFSLCPSGSGPNSIRFWESLSFGTIPVLLSDTYVLPPIKGWEWNECIIVWKESDIEQLYDYLHNFDSRRMEYMSHNCVDLYNAYFSEKTFHRGILEYFQYAI
jgi:hypothetical protein